MMKETPTSGVSARDDDGLGSPAIKLFRQVTPRKLGIKCPSSLRNRVQSTCLDDAAHLKTYMRLWILVEVMLLFHDPWLIPQGGFTKFVYQNGRGGRSCRIRAAGAYFWKACADDEPGLLPAPGGWLAKIRIFFPLPVRAGLDELPCID